MKKLFIMLLMVSAVFTAKSQSATLMPLVFGDTLVMAAGLDTVSKVIPATAGYSAFGLQVVQTKLSGTVSGKAYLYGSLDGTNYILTDSSSAFTDITTNTAFFAKSTTPFTYYKLQVRPMGNVVVTNQSIVRVYYVYRKYSH